MILRETTIQNIEQIEAAVALIETVTAELGHSSISVSGDAAANGVRAWLDDILDAALGRTYAQAF